MTQYWDLEGETPGGGSKPDRGVLGSLVKDCGAVYQEAIFIATAEMLLDILPFNRHMRVQFEGLEMHIGLHLVSQPLQCLL